MSHRAVLDIGKTHVKLLVFDADGQPVEQRVRPNASVMSDLGYPALDTAGIEAWLYESLASLPQRGDLTHIVATTHGAAFAALAAGKLALPVIDYEFDGVSTVDDAYAREAGEFSETLSPLLPGGLNAGKALYWLQRQFPERFAHIDTILPYPQYWAWLLSGVAASEVTSLGCHTHLWAPAARDFSRFAHRQGWAAHFAPLRPAWDALGTVRPELARRLGLPADCQVLCGIHDSNACLARYLKRWPAMTLISSGTWTVIMAPGGGTGRLDPARDMLGNVSLTGEVVPTARFMGGREFAWLLDGAKPDTATAEALAALIRKQVFAIPSFARQGGPFGGHPGYVEVAGERLDSPLDAVLSEEERATLAAFYCAQVSAWLVQYLDAPSPLVVDGPYARNPLYLSLLAGLLPGHTCFGADSELEGTAAGAWLLTGWGDMSTSQGEWTPVEALKLDGLSAYQQAWQAKLPSA